MKTRARWSTALFCSVAVLTGCGGSSASPTRLTYENVAGTYNSNVTGTLPGAVLNGTLTLTLQQSDAVLSGGHVITATVNNGSPGQGSVVLTTGTVASGPNPAVNYTVRSEQCPASPPADWTGSYQSSSGELSLRGTIHLLNQACVTLLSFPVSVVMKR